MTEGSPARLILRFSLPMLVGNLFQQFYNIVDTVVVGRFVSYQALAAVGASFAVMTFVNSIIIGLCMGASVLFAQLYGAGDREGLSGAAGTAFSFITACSAVMGALAFALTDPIVALYRMPPETVTYSGQYLRFIFAGLVFTGLYNFCAFYLRALGDSRTPLVFLVAACLLNIVLDLVFVLGFGMAVKGVALATFLAQALSAVLCALATLARLRGLGIAVSLRPRRGELRRVLSYSVLTGVQQSVMNFGILLVQGLVNTFGAVTIAAFSAGVKIDSFAYIPVQDFGNALSTYVAQNHGAGRRDRIRRGVRFAVGAIAVFCAVASAVIVAFAPGLIRLFVGGGETAVIQQGARYLRIEGVCYLLIGYLFLFYGFFRGVGRPAVSVVLTVVSLGTRVLLAYLLAPAGLGFSAVPVAIVAGWLLADACGVLFYRRIMAQRRPSPNGKREEAAG